MRRIRAIVYGVGAMGKVMTRLMVEKGVDIVGAIDVNPALTGKDLGAVAGLDRSLNMPISEDADAVVSERQADIAVVAVGSFMKEMFPHFARCLENGVNVISTCEESLYPWTTSPEITSRLDRLARQHGVTITGCGYQDAYWVNLISVLTGTSHSIDSVECTAMWNVDDYGPEVARDAHIGETKEEFERFVKEHGWPPSFGRNSMESLIADIGLTIRAVGEGTEPQTLDVDVRCSSLDTIVPAGCVVGYSDVVDIETEEGPTFRMRMIGRLYREEESDVNEWSIRGVPNLYLRNDHVDTRTTTCTQMVNRIPDVISSEAGYVTIEQLPKLKYRAFPLGVYLVR